MGCRPHFPRLHEHTRTVRTSAGLARYANGGGTVSGVESCVLLKFGEMALKGRNRRLFVAQLERNLKRSLEGLGAELRLRAGAIALVAPGEPEVLLSRARDAIGVSVLHPAVIVEKSPEAAAAVAVDLVRGRAAESFAIRARRRDKRFPASSRELAILAGRAVQDELGLRVDLDNPDIEVHMEVDEREVFAYTEKLRGRGGLPVGASGRAAVMLSGGIDSPVAAYRAMRRGLRCDFVHFSGEPFTGPESIYKAYAHVRELDRFQSGSRLFVVPFGTAQRALASAGAERLQVMAQRRLMAQVASAIGKREGARTLVTGDSLGQVASQTLQNLAVVEEAAGLPLLRPLIAFDKAEIIAEAEELGTLEISHLPDEDCCQLFAPRLAETRADPERLRRLERLVDSEQLVEGLIAAARLVEPAADAAPAEGPSTAETPLPAGV
jgi:tRNA uracil 4-sulfurtransferase